MMGGIDFGQKRRVMESPKLDRFITIYTGLGNPEVGRVGWSDDAVWLDAAATKKGLTKSGTIGFRGVPKEIGTSMLAATRSARSGSRTARAGGFRRTAFKPTAASPVRL